MLALKVKFVRMLSYQVAEPAQLHWPTHEGMNLVLQLQRKRSRPLFRLRVPVLMNTTLYEYYVNRVNLERNAGVESPYISP